MPVRLRCYHVVGPVSMLSILQQCVTLLGLGEPALVTPVSPGFCMAGAGPRPTVVTELCSEPVARQVLSVITGFPTSTPMRKPSPHVHTHTRPTNQPTDQLHIPPAPINPPSSQPQNTKPATRPESPLGSWSYYPVSSSTSSFTDLTFALKEARYFFFLPKALPSLMQSMILINFLHYMH